MSYCFNHSGINVGLAIGLSFGLLALILIIGIPLCIFGKIYLSRRANRPVRTRVVATNPSAVTTTVVTSNQAGMSTAAPAPYPQEPVYKDTQLSIQDAPPSYTDVTAPVRYPQEQDTQFSSQDAPPSYTDVTALPQPV